jgi:hypothetical protein
MIEVVAHGSWEFATKPSSNGGGFVGWCRVGKIVGDDAISEPCADVWFEFGESRDEVIAKLMREVGAMQ